MLLGVEAHELGKASGAVRQRAIAAQAIDRPSPRGDREPCPGVGGHPVASPCRDGRGERILNGVLGELEIANMSDQRREHLRALVAKRARDSGGGLVIRRPPLPGAAHACSAAAA